MKSFDEIGNELRGVQDSWRHPKPDKSGAFPHNPKPEGEIAARSVQFLQTELEVQLKIRDEALESGGNAREDVTRLTAEVARRDERMAGLEDNIARKQDRADIKRVNAKLAELEAEVERGEARREVIRESAAASRKRDEAEMRLLRDALAAKAAVIADLKEALQRWQDTERLNRQDWEARKERLNSKICETLGDQYVLSGKLRMKDEDIERLEEQVKVSTIAALGMFQKLKAAAVMAKSATAQQTAQYLLDSVNFHINGAMEVVNWLNGDSKDEAKDDQHLTDGEEPEPTG